MSTAALEAAAPAPPRRRRRWLWWLLPVVVIAVVVLFALLLVAGTPREDTQEPLDPDNPTANGAAALAAVLADQGVEVEIARNRDQLEELAPPDSDTTVIVTSTDQLNDSTSADLRTRVALARHLILVDPGYAALSDFGLETFPHDATSPDPSIAADCTAPGISADDRISRSADAYFHRPGDPPLLEDSCFPDGTGYQLLTFPATGELGLPPATVVTGEFLTNDAITRYDNAGVAVRLLGASDRLVWYIPSRYDVDTTEPAGLPDIPRVLGPLVLLSFFAVLVLMVWRGVRFGPLAGEPLPVTVKAAETTQARGRLYHRAKDAPRAAGLLREHTLRRLGDRLALPYRPADPGSTSAIAEAAARATGRDPAEIHDLLAAPPPSDDRGLVDYVSRLTALDQEVHRTP